MIQTLKNIIKFIVYPFLYPILWFSYLLPRDKNMWLFGSVQETLFSDNVKYLFIYVVENCPEIRAIWVSSNKQTVKHLKSEGFEVYYKYSLQAVYYAFRGAVYFVFTTVSNINFWASGGAVGVNLWHGVPIKKIGFDVTDPMCQNTFTTRFLYPDRYFHFHYVLSTSQKVSELFVSAFRVDIERCLVLGYPRNEILLYSENKIMNFIEKYEPIQTKELIFELKAYKKVFVYMPTWRDNGQNFIKNAGFDFEVLNHTLQKKNYCLLLKLHHLTNVSVNLEQYKNILLIDNTTDMYPILPFTDCLITDYSSVYFDYHLMDKEVILFPFDKTEYIEKDREMYYNYDAVTDKELVVNNFEELIKAIESDAKGSGIKNNLVKEMILETRGIESSKKIVKIMKNYKL